MIVKFFVCQNMNLYPELAFRFTTQSWVNPDSHGTPSCKALSVKTALFQMLHSINICSLLWVCKTGHTAGEKAVIPWILPNPDAIFFQDSPRSVEA